jgi:broad specificity phosphatase PhoE
MTRRLLLARHGQSTTNAADVFTGWSDPPLTELGVAEAHGIADTLADADARPDAIFTSSLQRTIHTAAIVRDDLGLSIELRSSQALDERDYGDLTGMNKAEIAERYGAEQTPARHRGAGAALLPARHPAGGAQRSDGPRRRPWQQPSRADDRAGRRVARCRRSRRDRHRRDQIVHLGHDKPDQ